MTCGSHGTVASAREERPGSGPTVLLLGCSYNPRPAVGKAVRPTGGNPAPYLHNHVAGKHRGFSLHGWDQGACHRLHQVGGTVLPGVTADASLDTDVPGGNTLCSNCAANVTRRQASCGRAPGGGHGPAPGRTWAKPLSGTGHSCAGEGLHLRAQAAVLRSVRRPACPLVWPLRTVQVAWGPEENHQDWVGGAQPGRKRAGSCCPEGSARFPVPAVAALFVQSIF